MGNQTLPRGYAPRESQVSLGTSLGKLFPDNSCGFSTVCPKDQGEGMLNLVPGQRQNSSHADGKDTKRAVKYS